MKIQLTQQNLSQSLAVMSRVASVRTELPVLANVLIEAKGGDITLSATNLEVAVTHQANAKVSSPGKVAVPARLFHEFIAQLPKDQVVSLSLEKNKVLVEAGGYSSHIQGVDAEDFPALPQIPQKEHIKVNNEQLVNSITKTVLAASRDETRPVLGGVFAHTHNGVLYFTATDGYRLAEVEVIKTNVEASCIIPLQALQEVLKIAQDSSSEDIGKLYITEDQFAYTNNETTLVSRLIEGSYPEYRKLIPEKSETNLVINKAELQTAAKLAGLFARESGGSITITASEESGKATVASVASQVGDNTSSVEATISGEGSVVVNVRYLNDALNCFEAKEVNFRFGDSIAPCVLSSKEQPGYQHIVMPLKS